MTDIERYKARMNNLLADHDNARMVFDLETRSMEKNIETRCLNSFLTGAVISGLITAVIIFSISRNEAQILEYIIGVMK